MEKSKRKDMDIKNSEHVSPFLAASLHIHGRNDWESDYDNIKLKLMGLKNK